MYKWLIMRIYEQGSDTDRGTPKYSEKPGIIVTFSATSGLPGIEPGFPR